MKIKTPEGSRFQAWVALFIFSCVCLTAHVSTIDYTNSSVDWVTAALSISLIFSFFATIAHFVIGDKFIGQKMEGGVAVFLLIIWCACLPTIMRPCDNIAVSGAGQGIIINSNLYFFSWISFVCVILILGGYCREVMGLWFKKTISPKTTTWLGLLAVSVVVLATASEIHKDVECVSELSDLSFCQRTNYAIALGLFGMIIPAIALVLIVMEKITLTIETALSGVMFVMYTFGVGFITFGDDRPAASGGNLYFSSWIGFTLTVVLLSKCVHQIHHASKNNDSTATTTTTPATDAKETATLAEHHSDIEANDGSINDPSQVLSDIEENEGSAKGLSDEENDGVEQPVQKVAEL